MVEPGWVVKTSWEAAAGLTAIVPELVPVRPGALKARVMLVATLWDRSVKVATPSVAFAQRRGVCQDFAHVMISGLRGLGLPAAYVSGYLRTIPPAGRERLEGADAMHAWVLIWCGPGIGWRGFYSTNSMVAGNDHVVLAIGRDYADVAPIDGVILASGEQHLEVSVNVIPLQ